MTPFSISHKTIDFSVSLISITFASLFHSFVFGHCTSTRCPGSTQVMAARRLFLLSLTLPLSATLVAFVYAGSRYFSVTGAPSWRKRLPNISWFGLNPSARGVFKSALKCSLYSSLYAPTFFSNSFACLTPLSLSPFDSG